jgi:SAM-dependent methyltransferase
MSDDPSKTFDVIWEEGIYGEGHHLNRYPFDTVVSFVFRNFPRDRPRESVHILEVGCGTGNNLWFAAREGFSVSGIDGSTSAIQYARSRFSAEQLSGDLRVGDFTELPFGDSSFDLAVDRCAITCCGLNAGRSAVQELHRVLKPGGRALINPYSDRHTSRLAGRPGPDGLTLDIGGGTLTGVGQICFYGEEEIYALIAESWNVLSQEHLVVHIEHGPLRHTVHSEWRIVVEKKFDI